MLWVNRDALTLIFSENMFRLWFPKSVTPIVWSAGVGCQAKEPMGRFPTRVVLVVFRENLVRSIFQNFSENGFDISGGFSELEILYPSCSRKMRNVCCSASF